MMYALLRHIAESSLFALMVLILAFLLKDRAAIRHRLWVTAMLKFAVPFGWFGALGATAGEHFAVTPLRLPELYTAALTSPAAPAASVQGTSWVPTACLVFWLGAAALLLVTWVRRFGRGIGNTAFAGPRNEAILLRCAERLKLRSMPRLRMTSHLQEPCVLGVLRPVVVVPEGLSSRLGPDAFQAVLMHELAHVRRKDNLWAVTVHAVCCVFWFHPLVWWMERRARGEAELACDALVLEAGTPREAYASSLIEVCRMSLLEPVAGSSSLGGVNLKNRLEKIMSNRIESRMPRWMNRLGGALLASGCGMAFVLGASQSHAGLAQAAGRNEVNATGVVRGCAAGQPEPFAVGTVVRHMPRQQMQVCVLDGGTRPVWLTLAKGGVPADIKVIDLPPTPPVFCKETAPQGKFCTCDSAIFSPGAVVDSARGKLACPVQGGRWQPYKRSSKAPWPPVALTE